MECVSSCVCGFGGSSEVVFCGIGWEGWDLVRSDPFPWDLVGFCADLGDFLGFLVGSDRTRRGFFGALMGSNGICWDSAWV